MAEVIFEDYSMRVQSALAEKIDAALEEAAAEVESQTKRNCHPRVDTGQTKNSYKHRVTGSVMAGHYEAHIGSDYENAIWEEFGTGEHALNGNGRKGGWAYEDEWGVWHYTLGKKPHRPMQRAYESKKKAIMRMFQNKLKGL